MRDQICRKKTVFTEIPKNGRFHLTEHNYSCILII